MEECAKIIKQLGGIFYIDPKDCTYLDLDSSQEEGNNNKGTFKYRLYE
jgi:hypothetical protein